MKLLSISLLLSISILTQSASAQFPASTKEQFYKIMLAFPDGFESIKGASLKLDNIYYSKVSIDKTQYSIIEKNDQTGHPQLVAHIFSSESVNMDEFKKRFTDWEKNINQLDLRGAVLTDYPNDKYKINLYDMYVQGKAWRLESVKQSIEDKYKGFTIRLELLDLDQGGFTLQLLFGQD